LHAIWGFPCATQSKSYWIAVLNGFKRCLIPYCKLIKIKVCPMLRNKLYAAYHFLLELARRHQMGRYPCARLLKMFEDVAKGYSFQLTITRKSQNMIKQA